MAIKEY